MGHLNWLDVAVIAVIVVSALDGFAKGLIISLFNTIGFFGACIAAKYLSHPIANYICSNTKIDDALIKWLEDRILNFNPLNMLPIFSDFSRGQEASALSKMILVGIIFIAVLSCISILITILANGINMAARLPVVRQFNSLGGLIFGILKGLMSIYLIFALLTLVIPFMKPSNPFNDALSSSKFAVYFYTYNFIIPWVQGII